MTFARVAAAILMFKLLELCWGYAFIVADGGEAWKHVAVMTIAWGIVSFFVWALLVQLENAIDAHRNRNG